MGSKTTPFIGDTTLFYIVGNYELLFSSIGTRSRKQFFEKISERNKQGGEGISEPEWNSIVLAGIQHGEDGGNLKATIADAAQLRAKYIQENDAEAFENLVSLAWANSGLTNLKAFLERVEMLTKAKENEMDLIRIRLGLPTNKSEDSYSEGDDRGEVKNPQ
jgi:hypothetical protein